MNLLVCSPGADYATGDVCRGLVGGLRRLGHRVDLYNLGHRITVAGVALKTIWRWHKKKGGPLADVQPGPGDIVHEASTHLLYKAWRGPDDGSSGPYDACLIITGMYLHPDIVITLHRTGLPLGLVLSESPYNTEQEYRLAKHADVCWTNERASVRPLRYANPNTHYLPHAYDPDQHRPVEKNGGGGDGTRPPAAAADLRVPGGLSLPASLRATGGARPAESPPNGQPSQERPARPTIAPNGGRPQPGEHSTPDVEAHDVVFVGTGFEERIEILSAVDWDGLGIDLGLYGNWTLLGSGNRLRRYLRAGVVSNLAATALYRRAKIGLNLYRSSMGYGRGTGHVRDAESLNPRALELAACGVFTVSDDRAEVREVFGSLVPTFSHPKEVGPLLKWWLDHPVHRHTVAGLLPARVAGRTFDAMAAQVAGQLAGVLARRAGIPVLQEAAG